MKRLFAVELVLVAYVAFDGDAVQRMETNMVVEISFQSQKSYDNPFIDVELDVVFSAPDGTEMKVPAFWAGGDTWKVRYASPAAGTHHYRTASSDTTDSGLHGVAGQIEINPYTGDNPLYRHGPLKVATDNRHFAHADGTPFFWLGDTWWKCLAKRLDRANFQELTADRKAKGFTVVQIVCGPYPDEDAFEEMWENEGGKPYLDRPFTQINPTYFDHADRRFEHLVDEGIVPAIVGSWARADCDSMKSFGVEGLKRHWRYLVARYGAYPVVWIVAGEVSEELRYGRGPWGEVAKYLRSIDPYHRISTSHAGCGHDEPLVVDFDMVGGSHDASVAVQPKVLDAFHAAYAGKPPVPVLCGETCYEGHMQQGWQDVQRQMFWMFMLSGAAGHTYGAAGIWHASVEGDPGCASSAFGGRKVYDWTTWREGMNYPGSAQLGLCKKLLEEYPWHRFEPHPEWAEEDCYAAGIPGEVRFIYQPKRGIYNWQRTIVKEVETNVSYSAFYFDSTTGRRFDQGKVKLISGDLGTFEGHTQPLLYEDDFDRNAVGFTPKGKSTAWKDYGTPTQRKDGILSGAKGVLSIVEAVDAKDVVVSCASARSDAEAGLILRFQDPDNYIVALYSPHFKRIFIHDRRNGNWGAMLGTVDVPEIGPEFRLCAAAIDDYAALVVSDGRQIRRTPPVKITNTDSGKTGLWFYQIGEQQAFGKFEVSRTAADSNEGASTGEYLTPDLPSPQDWVLVLERDDVEPSGTQRSSATPQASATSQGNEPYPSATPKFVFAETLEEQTAQLKDNPLMLRFAESRKRLQADRYRPLYHFVSPESQLNDPNGLCFWQGRWHLFYQAYPPDEFPDPADVPKRRQHWGHAVSEDLVHWRDLPYATYPGRERMCFSGSTVVEEDRVVAFYPGIDAGQMVAISDDPLLLNWDKMGPVNCGGGDSCIWKEGDTYLGLTGRTLWASRDLENWENRGEFFSGVEGACPNFVPIGDKHMILSFSHSEGGQYQLGDYDPAKRTFTAYVHGRFNHGKVSPGGVHAPSAAADGKGGVINILNINDAEHSREWDQILSVAQQLTLGDDKQLRIAPVAALATLRGDHQQVDAMTLPANEEVVLSKIEGDCLDIELELDPQMARWVELRVLRSPNAEEYTSITFYNFDRKLSVWYQTQSTICLDNSRSSTNPNIWLRPPECAPLTRGDAPLRLRVLVDRSVVEVFANDTQYLAMRVYPAREDSLGISLRAQGQDALLNRLDAWQMKSMWPAS